MAATLGVAASLIAVLQLSTAVGKYLCRVSNAPEDCKKLLLEVTAISGLICHLESLVTDVEFESGGWTRTTQSLAITDGPLDQLNEALTTLHTKFTHGRASGTRQAISWPFKKGEVKDILELVARLKTCFILALQNDHFRLTAAVHDSVSMLFHRVDQQEAENNRRRNDETRHRAIGWISKVSFRPDHEELKEAWQRWYPEPRMYESGGWLLSHQLFRTWRDFQGSSILWVNGKPGSGKSVLASRVVTWAEDFLQPKRKSGLGYVYCSSRDVIKTDPTVLASCILQQLCIQLPTLDDAVFQLYQKYRDEPHARPGWLEVKDLLLSVLSNFHHIYFIVDGLDECADQKKFAALLFRIHELPTPVTKIIFFSRSANPPLEAPFRHSWNHIVIDSNATRNDIEFYATVRLSTLSLRNEGLRNEIARSLVGKADGMFLWVHLQIEALTEQPDPEILSEIPQGLQAYFERSMRRTQDFTPFRKRCTAQILFWVVNAKRPLHSLEMIEAISPESSNLEAHDLVEFCAGLVQLDGGGYVQLFHSSARDLLISGNFQPEPGSTMERFLSFQRTASDILLSRCLDALMLPTFSGGPASGESEYRSRVKSHPFHVYAAQYWAHHYWDAPTVDRLAIFSNLFQSPPAIEAYLQSAYALGDASAWDKFPRNRTGLHIIARFDLTRALEHLPNAKKLAKVRDSWGYRAMDLAFRRGHRQMCQSLLDFETFISERIMNEYPLHRAIENDWPELVERLLHMRANLELRNSAGYTPLHVACRYCENSSIVNILLDAGADIEAQTQEQCRPLMLAAEAGRLEILQILVDAGADTHATDSLHRCPLHFGARSGQTVVARFLIDKGLDPNVLCAAEETPLHVAAMTGHKEFAKSLITAGGNVNATSVVGATPLHLAVAWGFDELVLALLAEGADPLLADKFYWNPIHILAFMRRLSLLSRFNPPLLPPRKPDTQPSNPDILSQLFDSLRARNSDVGNTLLWTSGTEAFFYVCVERVDLLTACFEQGVPANTADRHGVSLLHSAAAANSSVIVSALLENGADVNAKDMWGRTPYELAVGKVGEEVRALLKRSENLEQMPIVDPETLEVQNCWVMQHVDRNFVLYVRCNECGTCVDGVFLHCTLCTSQKDGYDACGACVTRRRLLVCPDGHTCRNLQLLTLRDHSLSFAGAGMKCVHDYFRRERGGVGLLGGKEDGEA